MSNTLAVLLVSLTFLILIAILPPQFFGRGRLAKRTVIRQEQKGARAVAGRRLRICLFGAHARQTPLARPPYQRLFTEHLEIVENLDDAELGVVGFSTDIRDNAGDIARAAKRNPRYRLVALSEEPLWDTVWGQAFWKPQGTFEVDGAHLDYAVLNHTTSSIFDFENVPYLVTTRDEFFERYSRLFRRNAGFTPKALLAQWQTANWRTAFYAEKRTDSEFNVRYPEKDIEGLCVYRTRLAELMTGDRSVRVGIGWSEGISRHTLLDWHLDKLAALDGQAFIVSSIENTHQRNYVSEKVFDAFAVAAVPLYYASPAHRIHELISEKSYLNLFGLTPEEAASLVAGFSPDIEYAERYLETQNCLSELFSSPAVLQRERHRIVMEVVRSFTRIRME